MISPLWGRRAGDAIRADGSTAPRRRRVFQLEALEDRAVPALGFGTAIGIGGANIGAGQIALDSAGNTYVTGAFTGTVNFDPAGGADGIIHAGAVNASTYVAKYSPSDALVWVDDFTAPAGDSASSSTGSGLAVDNNTGVVYVAGRFAGSIVFDPASSAAPTYTTGGTASSMTGGFLVKLSSDGSLVPADVRTFGGSSSGAAAAFIVKVSPDGTNVYVGGSFSGSVNFDPGQTNFTLNDSFSSGVPDGFLLDFSSDFALRYAAPLVQFGGSVNDLAADNSGDVYVVGQTNENNQSDAYVDEFNASGIQAHAKDFGGPSTGVAGANAQANGVAIDGAGNVYICGLFAGTSVPFGPFGGSTSQTLSSAGPNNMFLIKLDPSFGLVWSNRFGSTSGDSANAMAIDGDGHLLVAGILSGPSTYGTNDLGPIVLGSGTSLVTPFVLEVDSAGDLVGAITPMTFSKPNVFSIAANASDQVVIDGVYSGSATFGNVTLGPLGTDQIFLATITGAATPTPIATSPLPPPPPVASPPVFLRETRLTTGKGPHKKVTGFELEFSTALETSVAENTSHYRVIQPGRTRKSAPKVIAVRSATIGPGGTSVTLTLGKYVTTKPLSLTGTGLAGANGTSVAAISTRL